MNIKSQYALAFCTYLVKANQVTINKAATDLGLSPSFLSQVVRKLRIANILDVRKGPGGGYWFKGGNIPTVLMILEAVDNPWVTVSLNASAKVADDMNKVLREVYDRSIQDYSSQVNQPEIEAEASVRS